jgi:hypothetical protein
MPKSTKMEKRNGNISENFKLRSLIIANVQPRIRGSLAACCFNFVTAIKSKTSAVCFRRFNKFTKPRETERRENKNLLHEL